LSLSVVVLVASLTALTVGVIIVVVGGHINNIGGGVVIVLTLVVAEPLSLSSGRQC